MSTYFHVFYIDGVLTEATQYKIGFYVRQFRELHGMAYGWYPNTHKAYNMAWFSNVSKSTRSKALKIFKLLQLEEQLNLS